MHHLEHFERPCTPDIELAGSLQAVLNDIKRRNFSPDLQQTEALEAIGKSLIDGTRSGYIEMATGTGKTLIASLVAEAAAKAGKRALILASNISVAKQSIGDNPEKPTGLARFASLDDSTSVAPRFGKTITKTDADIVVATYSGFLNDFKKDHTNFGEFDVVIADECHRSLGKQTSNALQTAFPGAFKLGLSATPDYAIDRKSEEVFSTRLYEFSLIDAVRSGKTAPVRALIYETNETLRLSDNRREFTDRELAPLIDNPERNATALSLAEAFVKEGRQGIIACIPGQANLHARLLVDLLKQRGVRATDVGSHLDEEEQALRLKLYESGIFDVLTFTRSLEEGWDSDAASFAINLAPTSSPVRTKQLLGRVLRKKLDGLESIYIDFIDEKSGVGKSQYTAMHALDLETIDFNRVLGHYNSTQSSWDHTSSLLHIASAKLLARLRQSQGKLLKDVAVGQKADPLVRQWNNRLASEGMPAELDSHHVLSVALAKQAHKAYEQFYRDNRVAPTSDELLDLMKITSEKQRRLLGNYLIRAEFDTETQLDLDNIPASDDLSDQVEISEDSDLSEKICEALDTLSEREAGTVSMRYGLIDGEPATLDDIGKVYGVQRERIRQIESKTMSKLRHPDRSKLLKDFVIDNSSKTNTDDEPTLSKSPNKIVSNNEYIRQFKKFEEVAQLPTYLNLIPYVLSDEYKAQYPWLTDDSMRRPFEWRNVVEARRRLGINRRTTEAFTEREALIDEAIHEFSIPLKRLNDLPLADHDSSIEQRLATIKVYESRINYLETLKRQLNQLKTFLKQSHELLES